VIHGDNDNLISRDFIVYKETSYDTHSKLLKLENEANIIRKGFRHCRA